MATAKPNHSQRVGPPRHRWRNTLVAVLLLAALAIALLWHQLRDRAMLAAAYGARIACTCHYIEGRGLDDCHKDFEPGMALVMLRDNARTRTITASVPLVTSQTARFHDGFGCLLQNWAP